MIVYAREMSKLPRFYGIAYYKCNQLTAVAYPVPLNIFIGLSRKVWISLIQNKTSVTGYDTGYTKGFSEGKHQGKVMAHNQTLPKNVHSIVQRFLQDMTVMNTPDDFQQFLDDQTKRLEIE